MSKKFNSISRNKADAAFSNYIRARAGWKCERCNLTFSASSTKNLHCSHNYSRSEHAIRYHPYNAFALCRDCHNWFSFNKIEATKWFQDKLGSLKVAELLAQMDKGLKPDLGRGSQDISELAAYYQALAGYEDLKNERISPQFRQKMMGDLQILHQRKLQDEANRERKQQQNTSLETIHQRDMLERMLQTYTKLPKDKKKPYRAQIVSLMEKIPLKAKKTHNEVNDL